MKMRVYIANLGKYNEGELIGEWFKLPIDFNEVKERIKLNNQYEEYAIHDIELPFHLNSEYISIDELNRLYEMALELEGSSVFNELEEIQSCWFNDFADLFEHRDDIIHHGDCFSMADVAQAYIEDTGILADVPTNLQNYIDYDALGRDMCVEGSFLVTSHGVYEYCR